MVDIIGRAKVVVTSQIDKSSIDETGGKIGAGLKKGAIVGVAALGTLAAGAFSAYKSFEEAEAVSRKLNNTLDNMGQGDAAPRIEKLADELRKLTGIDDEVIKGGQTILALFPEVAESADKVGGAFDRASALSLDMSRIFGSVESASRTLGKALSDPEKASLLLRRANVFLSEEQKKLIDSFVAVGDTAGAQNVILKALEDRYKGTAESAATESEKIESAMGEIKETLGGMVEELLTGEDSGKSFAESLENINTELDELSNSEGWQGTVDAIHTVGGAIGWAGEKLNAWTDYWEGVGERSRTITDQMGEDWSGMWENISEAWDDFKRDFVDDIENIPLTLERRKDQFKRAGRKLLGAFVEGLADSVISGGPAGAIAQKIKDAINNALPDSLTFFAGRGGIPAITVPIPQLATGTRNFGGGLAKVGEHGAEYVSLPAGSDVYNASHTQQIDAAANAGGGLTVNYNNYGPQTGADRLADLKWLSRYAARMGAPTAAGV